MREKKSMKKISDAGVIETQRKKNRKNHFKEVATKMKDSDLFTVNMSKDGLREKREKLAADRFKKKNTEGNLRSKTEVALLKKLGAKGPSEAKKEEAEVFDVWGTSSISSLKNLGYQEASKKQQKFKAFS